MLLILRFSGLQRPKSLDYIDFKDDRVLSYFDLNVGERITFRVLLNASYVGKYYLPMFNCEAMYDNTIYARNAGRWVMVK